MLQKIKPKLYTDNNNTSANLPHKNIIESLKDKIPDSNPIYVDGFKYVVYTPSNTFEKANKITYIFKLNKKNVNNRQGEKRLCYGSISYIKAEKMWIFNKQHSEYCNEYYKNIHSQQKLDTSANFKRRI